MIDLFLSREEIATLTGRKTKSKQIEQLRKMGIPFFVNAINAPVVTRVAVEGRTEDVPPTQAKWQPRVLYEDTPNRHAFEKLTPHQEKMRTRREKREKAFNEAREKKQ